MKKSIFGIARSEAHANETLNLLENSGINREDFSALFYDIKNQYSQLSNGKNKGNLAHEKHTKAPEGGATGALTGGVIGGTIGLLAGIGLLAIPGLGAFVAAGPILAALGGSAVGGSLGLLIGSLIGLGIPEYEAKKYEERLKKGGILIAVHCDTKEELDRVKHIMENNGIENISEVKESTVSRSNRM